MALMPMFCGRVAILLPLSKNHKNGEHKGIDGREDNPTQRRRRPAGGESCGVPDAT